jgi:hypothetical protein
MNYAQSRQRKDDGVWHWTVRYDDKIYVHVPCTSECNHETQEEADKHFYEWSLSKVEEIRLQNMQLKCSVCEAFTDTELGNRGFWMYFSPTPLCDKHRNQDELRKLHPFESPIEIIYS